MPKKLSFTIFLFCFFSFIFQNKTAFAEVDIYQYTHAGMFSPSVKNALFRVYVPNSKSGTVSVIDPSTYKVIQVLNTGYEPQHVVPSYDLQTLWVLNNKSNTVTPIDPNTANLLKSIAVEDPYNLYFTPDGKFAIVVCEGREQLQFRDPKTMNLISILPTQCVGANHMEFSSEGDYAIVTCEFSGKLMKIDLNKHQVIGYLSLMETINPPPVKKPGSPEIVIDGAGHFSVQDHTKNHAKLSMTSMPQDIRSTADGKIFYVADMMKDGVILIDPINFKKVGFIHTGIGTHAVYPSRDGKLFYVSNRGCHHTSCSAHGPGSISVINPEKQTVIATWNLPQGGSPDMGNVSPDGKELWLSGRYDREVYVFDTTTGQLTHRIPVGEGPHGLAIWPQPGRVSLGHTGNMR